MNAISKTAYYCCGTRAQDAASARPVCGDIHAATFLAGEGQTIFAGFAGETRPNQSNVARHRIIDDRVRQVLASDPGRWIVVIGAGFDSRPYRLAGGRWIELDEASIIDAKAERLPEGQCPNPLTRIAIDFGRETVAEKLDGLVTQPPLVIVEGVILYLESGQLRRLLGDLGGLFPEHELVCDLMTVPFFDRYGRRLHEKLAALGASFGDLTDQPDLPFREAGYRLAERTSITARGATLRGETLAALALRWFLPTLASGYAVYRFQRIPTAAMAPEQDSATALMGESAMGMRITPSNQGRCAATERRS